METENNVCSICLHEFTQPKLLTCLHSYCYQCLLDYVNRSKQDGDQFPCPLCRHQIQLPSGGVQDFPDSPHGQINEVGDVVKSSEAGDDVTSSGGDDVTKSADDVATNERPEQICDVCENRVVMKYQCTDCQQHFCEGCKKIHDKFSSYKKHNVVDISVTDHEGAGGDCYHVRSDDIKCTVDEVCTVHPHELINVHCTQCTASVCLRCFSEHHNGHKMLYLNDKETQTKLRQDLQKLNDDLQLQIDRLETFSNQLTSKRNELVNSNEQDCARVDQQIKLICEMAQTRGDDIKTRLRNTNDMERQKLETLMTEIESSIKRLKSDIKNASISLEGNSIINILDITNINQKVEAEFRRKDLVLPDLDIPYFKVGKIVEDQLLQQLGSVVNNEEENFMLNFNSNRSNGWPGEEKFFTFNGFKWRVRAYRIFGDDLCVRLYLCQSDSNNRDQRVEYSCTIINKTPSKSITQGPFTHQFTPGGVYNDLDDIPWSTLTDPSNGFIDTNGDFSIKIHIKLLESL